MKKLDDYAHDLQHKINERTREVDDEKQKADSLLYSVMPP